MHGGGTYKVRVHKKNKREPIYCCHDQTITAVPLIKLALKDKYYIKRMIKETVREIPTAKAFDINFDEIRFISIL